MCKPFSDIYARLLMHDNVVPRHAQDPTFGPYPLRRMGHLKLSRLSLPGSGLLQTNLSTT